LLLLFSRASPAVQTPRLSYGEDRRFSIFLYLLLVSQCSVVMLNWKPDKRNKCTCTFYTSMCFYIFVAVVFTRKSVMVAMLDILLTTPIRNKINIKRLFIPLTCLIVGYTFENSNRWIRLQPIKKCLLMYSLQIPNISRWFLWRIQSSRNISNFFKFLQNICVFVA